MSKSFTILATSDMPGYVMPYIYSDNSPAELGLAKIHTTLQTLKDENTLLIDNGDNIVGSPLTFYYNKNYSDKPHFMATMLNEMGYDYYNIGNHEFNQGPNVLKNYMGALQMPCLTGNLHVDNKPVSKPYYIHTFPNGIRIALFGMVTQHIAAWEPPVNLIGIEVEDAFEYCKKTVEQIKKNETVDAVVCVYHGGYEKDLHTGEPTENQNGENWGYKICTEIEGLDILITGHQHQGIADVCNGVITGQTKVNAQQIMKYTFDVDSRDGKCELINPTYEPDANIMELMSTLEEECQKWLDTPLGTTKAHLKVEDELEAREHKHPIISFINQVMLDHSKADLAATALFLNAKGFNSTITMRDIVATYVYANTMVTLEMDGHTVKEFLEKSAEYFAVIDGKIGVSPLFDGPKPMHFNYDMMDGLDYTIKVSNPIGSRIISMTQDGKPFDMDKKYAVVMSNYRSTGGGDFDMCKRCRVLQNDQTDMVDALAQYILDHPDIPVYHRDNITVIL